MNWNRFFNSIKNKDYFINLKAFLEEEYNNFVIYPEKEYLFNALEAAKIDSVGKGHGPVHHFYEAWKHLKF